MKNYKLPIAVILSLLVGVWISPHIPSFGITLNPVDETDAVTYVNNFGVSMEKNIDNNLGVRRVEFDQEMIAQLNAANEALKKPDYLRLYFGEVSKDNVGYVVVAYTNSTAVNVQTAGIAQDDSDEEKGGNNTDEMYYIKGRINPTCPKMCDKEEPFDIEGR